MSYSGAPFARPAAPTPVMSSDASEGPGFLYSAHLFCTAGCVLAITIGMLNPGLGGVDVTKTLFAWHPVFMTLGVVFFFAQGLAVHSTPLLPQRMASRAFRRKLHGLLMGCGAMSCGLGFGAVYVHRLFQNRSNFAAGDPFVFRLHVATGYSALAVVAYQVVTGVRKMTLLQATRQASHPKHGKLGLLGYFLGVLAVAEATTFWTWGRDFQLAVLFLLCSSLGATFYVTLPRILGSQDGSGGVAYEYSIVGSSDDGGRGGQHEDGGIRGVGVGF